MSDDLRNKTVISHSDVIALNFIRSSTPYVFRKHFRQGLRSHIMEILNPVDVTNEKAGLVIEGVQGVRRFPKAVPRRIFRIFRNHLRTLEEAWEEIERFKIISHYLAPDFMAHSTECIVDYHGPRGSEPLLCGFQEYIEGEILDPWTILGAETLLPTVFSTMSEKGLTMSLPKDEWITNAREKGARFISKIKSMITHSGYIPDLAGVGNLLITANGAVCLVDLNNISPVCNDASVTLDDKGYPVCDKSVESLSLIEEKIVGRPVDMGEKLYKLFLSSHRKRMVEEKMEMFRQEHTI